MKTKEEGKGNKEDVAQRERKPDRFEQIPLLNITVSKTNPRKHFDPKAMEDLRCSIETKGIIVPLVVRQPDARDGANSEHHYELVAGERRYRIAKELKLEKIPAIVKDLTDEEALEIQVIENLQRADVHPLDEAAGYAQLVKAGYAAHVLADKIGKSESYIHKRLKLLNLTDKLQKMYLDGDITFGHAQVLSRIDRKEQVELTKRLITKDYGDQAAQPISVRDLVQMVEKIYIDLKKAIWKLDDETLLLTAGKCSACPKNTAVQTDLFPEHAGRYAHCTDSPCFTLKRSAVLARIRRTFKEQHGVDKEVVLVDFSSYNNEPGVLDNNQWKLAKTYEECPSTKTGLANDRSGYGPDPKYKKWDLLIVCTNTKCEKHWKERTQPKSRMTGTHKPDPYKAKVELWQMRVEAALVREVMARIMDKMPKKLDRAAVEMFFRTAKQQVGHQAIVAVSGLLGEKKGKIPPKTDIKRIVQAGCACVWLGDNNLEYAGINEITKWAQRMLGIDLLGVKEKVEAEHPKPKPPKEKAGKKKAAAKKKGAKKPRPAIKEIAVDDIDGDDE